MSDAILPSDLSARYQEKFPDAVRRYKRDKILSNTRVLAAFLTNTTFLLQRHGSHLDRADTVLMEEGAGGLILPDFGVSQTEKESQLQGLLQLLRQNPPPIDVFATVQIDRKHYSLLQLATRAMQPPIHGSLIRAGADMEARLDEEHPFNLLAKELGDHPLRRIQTLQQSAIAEWLEQGWPLPKKPSVNAFTLAHKIGQLPALVDVWLKQYASDPIPPKASIIKSMFIEVGNLSEKRDALDRLLANPHCNAAIQKDADIASAALLAATADGRVDALNALLEQPMEPTVLRRALCTSFEESIRFLHGGAFLLLQKAGAQLDQLARPNKTFAEYYLSPFEMLAKGVSYQDDVNDEQDSRKLNAFSVIIRECLKAGYDPEERFVFSDTGTPKNVFEVIYESSSQKRLAHVLCKEGFPVYKANRPIQDQLIATSLEAYRTLWKTFSEKRKNPYLPGAEAVENDMLSDHPYALLQAFSAIGKLDEAMQPRYWPGEGGEAARFAAFSALYPYQQQALARDFIAQARQRNSAHDLGSWRACVSRTGQESIAIGG